MLDEREKQELRKEVLELEALNEERHEQLKCALQELNEWRVVGCYMPNIKTVEWRSDMPQALESVREMKRAWPHQHITLINPQGKRLVV